jgi:hypothetical protein
MLELIAAPALLPGQLNRKEKPAEGLLLVRFATLENQPLRRTPKTFIPTAAAGECPTLVSKPDEELCVNAVA